MTLPGDAEKDKGNEAFRKGDLESALKHFDLAISAAGETGSNLAALYSNEAAAMLKLGRLSDCILMCHHSVFAAGLSMELFSKNFRRLGEAYEAQGLLEEAISSFRFEQIHGVQPSDVALTERIAGLKAKLPNVKNHSSRGVPATLHSFMVQVKDALEGNVSSLKPLLSEFEIDCGAPITISPFMKNYGQLKSRDVLVAEHEELLAEQRNVLRQKSQIPDNPRLLSLAPAAVKHPCSPECAADLHELQRINIDQLRFEEVNVGKVLICRTIVHPHYVNALSSVIEDPAGNVVRFHAYNVCFKTTCIIGRPAVIIENISLLVHLEDTHDLLNDLTWQTHFKDIPGVAIFYAPPGMPDWQMHQNIGNDVFKKGEFGIAVAHYTDAIRLKEEGCKADLYSNRAAAYLKLGMFVQAIDDCDSARQLQPGHVKAAFRLAKGYAGLEDFPRARGVLARHPSAKTPEFASEIARLEQLILEQTVGKFDLKGLLKQAIASETIRFDHAEYNVDGIAYEWISDAKGFGVLAPRDYAPGDLIFVSKALAVVYNSELTPSSCSPAIQAQQDCVARVIDRVSKEPDFVSELNHLYAGQHFKRFKDFNAKEANAIDPRRVDAIVRLNAYGTAWRIRSDGELNHGETCVKYYGCRSSAFTFDGCGLWLLPSFLTHSCVPNTSRMFVGDIMFVRAAVPIAKGDELRTRKVLSGDFSQRCEFLAKKFGFCCDCELCECDRKRCDASPRLDEKRTALISELWDLYHKCVRDRPGEAPEIVNAKLVESVCEVAEQFAKRFAYKNRFDEYLARVYGMLGTLYMRQRKLTKAATAYEKSYVSLVGKENQRGRSSFIAETQPHFALTACFATALNFFWAGNREKGQQYYEELLRLTKRLCGSEDLEIISLLYPQLEVKKLSDAKALSDSGLKYRCK